MTGELYHVYNRGIDKRNIFCDQHDMERFFMYLDFFNDVETVGSIYEKTYERKQSNFGGKASKKEKLERKPLIDFVAYCVHTNHFHFLVRQVYDEGITKFMQKLGTGHAMYFNEKYDRTGSLFQGKFKSIHVKTNEYLLYLSAYINLNDRVHQIGKSKVNSRSSWDEYVKKNQKAGFCKKGIILDQFENPLDYKHFAEEALEIIQANKEERKSIEFDKKL